MHAQEKERSLIIHLGVFNHMVNGYLKMGFSKQNCI
jgi:hypothetical protein